MKTTILLFLFCTASYAQATDSMAHWAGKWRGTLVNLPARANAQSAKPVDVLMEIGGVPMADNTCTAWRTTYSEGGAVKGVKDYKLCRGTGADDLFIDEGNGIKLTARWLGDMLVTPFKYDNLLLLTTNRLRRDVLEQEIITIDDQPAIKGVQPLRARSIQRIELRRVVPPSQ
ncbi:MAG: hypothetical protein JNM09_22715 [Blastocatellia bacterium]|nr:hypothetical protein [Blastocatellia bacterium]